MIDWWKKLRGGSGKAPDDKPTVHITETGGWYVKADELLRSSAVREQIDSMAKISVGKTSPEGPKNSGRKAP